MLETSSMSTPVQEARETIKLCFFNKFWHFEFPDYSTFNLPDVLFYYDKAYMQDADVVVFHVPSLELIPQEFKRLKKKNGQLWVYWSFECEEHFPDFQKQEIRSLFDITATYQLHADISMPYLAACKDAPWRQEPVKKTAFINAFFSSRWDKSGRYDYLAELMSCLDVHSFGKILNNRTLEKDPYISAGLGGESLYFKQEVISNYKFTLAFENAIANDYVTEKFFQPLINGSIPVYLGAPNIEDFTPGDNCYINVKSFSSVRELADYLLLLDGNDELYNEYFAWKKKPFREQFESRLKLVSPDMIQRLIQLARERLGNKSRYGC